jgi:hypothetical protein
MRIIHYPIFLGCRDYAPTPFWRDVFENLAYKNPPRGIYLKDDVIYSVTKKKEFTYKFGDKTPEELYTDVYTLLDHTFGLKSKSDLTKKKEMFDEYRKDNSACTNGDMWSKIKRKSLKENLIQDFVVRKQREYDIPLPEGKKLYYFISVGLVFKVFKPTDIVMKNNRIESVTGVEFTNKKVLISRDLKEPVIKKHTVASVYLYELWKQYREGVEECAD